MLCGGGSQDDAVSKGMNQGVAAPRVLRYRRLRSSSAARPLRRAIGRSKGAVAGARAACDERRKERKIRGHELGSGHRTYLCLVIQGSLILWQGHSVRGVYRYPGVSI